MKYLLIALLAVPAVAVACPKDTVEWAGGCAAVPKTSEVAGSVKPSDEAPPRDKMPSYERENVHAVTPPSLIAQDAKDDASRMLADAAGKASAGIK